MKQLLGAVVVGVAFGVLVGVLGVHFGYNRLELLAALALGVLGAEAVRWVIRRRSR